MNTNYHTLNYLSQEMVVNKRKDGTILINSNVELGEYDQKITDKLEQWASSKRDEIFIAQRHSDHKRWVTLTYGETLAQVKSVGQFLLDQNLSKDRPVAILSGNSIEHLIVGLGAMYVGIPYAPISPAYSLLSKDFGKLRHIMQVMTPGLVFVDNLGPYRSAIDGVIAKDCCIVAVESGHALDDFSFNNSAYEVMINTPITPALARANALVNEDTIAKFLFTSGSTGMPKGVINTHKMLCANQVMLNTVLRFFKDEPPVICDWLPWSHTFGGNHNLGIALYNGGTYYIDEGKPVPHLIQHTIDNLAEISPTIYFNVPKGYEILVKKFKENPEVAKNFFKNLKVMYYAGAAISQHVWEGLDELSIQYTRKCIPLLSGLGSTETGPAALISNINVLAAGAVGVPYPGVAVKLVPCQDKMELRVKGKNITPGYWRGEDITQKAYDDEGFYCVGDALKFVDEADPNKGFIFDGRVSEDFKLDTGTWVSVSTLRPQMIHHFAPYIQDVVITGRDRSYIGAMVFPDMAQCRSLVGETHEGMSDTDILSHAVVREFFCESLSSLAQEGASSSMRIKRLVLMAQLPEIDKHEITDKGSLNQNALIENRTEEMRDLYSGQPSAQIIST